MRRGFIEQIILFLSILKWTVYATLVGVIVGFSTTIFLKSLGYSINFVTQSKYYFLLMPIAFFLSSLAIMHLAPESEGPSTDKIIDAVNKRFGKMNVKNSFVKLIATIITIVSGGSAGRVGPSAKIGGGVSSFFASILKLPPEDRKKLVVCGISAGFASVFGAPIAGAVFGVEVLYLGRIFYNVLFPSFVAGIVSFQTAKYLGITYSYNLIKAVPQFSGWFFLKVLAGGIFFGLVSLVLIEAVNFIRSLLGSIKIWKPIKGFLGGLFLVMLTFFVGTRYLGLGLESIESSLQGAQFSIFDPLFKIIFTAVTLGSGGSGGIITPIFFIGSTAGSFFAGLLKLDIATFAVIGMLSLLAGAANTPIAAFIMAIELFGPKVGVFVAVSCVVSFLMVGHKSIFRSQVLGVVKSPSLVVKRKEGEVGTVSHLYVKPRRRTLTWLLLKLGKAIGKSFRKAKR